MLNGFGSNENDCINGDHEPILDPVRGEYVCTACGLVLSRDFVPPPYMMEPGIIEDRQNSALHYVALGDRLDIVDGLGSYMGHRSSSFFYDGNGNPLPSKRQTKFKKLKYLYDLRARLDGRETDYRVLTVFNRICSMLDLNVNIKNRAVYLYRKFSKKLKKGDFYSHLNLVAVCLYLAVKESKDVVPLTLKEIAKAFQELHHRVSAKSIIKTALLIKPKFQELFRNHRAVKSEEYLPKIVNKILSSAKIKERVLKANLTEFEYKKTILTESLRILHQVSIMERGGRNPFIFAVAAAYAADQKLSKQRKKRAILTQSLLATATGAVEYSVRDHWRGLLFNHVFG